MKPANANSVFRALADPTRRAIFERLASDGDQTVHALTRYAGVSQPAVSKHLTVLKRAKLVRHRREGRETHYSAQPRALAPLVDWMNYYSRFWHDRLDRLENLLKKDGLDDYSGNALTRDRKANALSSGKNLARSHARLAD